MVHHHSATAKVQSAMMKGRRRMTLATFWTDNTWQDERLYTPRLHKVSKISITVKKLSIIYVNLTVINILL
jgi:hypothetical protein